jgi:hypothetical protein
MVPVSSEKNRRSLSSATGTSVPAGGVHAMRRGGARHEVSARVILKRADGVSMDGWALNVSRGGVRVILEDKVDLGAELEVTIGDETTSHKGRVVWVQDEPDGVVAGIEFTSVSGSHACAPPHSSNDAGS